MIGSRRSRDWIASRMAVRNRVRNVVALVATFFVVCSGLATVIQSAIPQAAAATGLANDSVTQDTQGNLNEGFQQVSCGGGTCVAVGSGSPTPPPANIGEGASEIVTGGTVGTLNFNSSGGFLGVDCISSSTCVGVGENSSLQGAVAGLTTNGVMGSLTNGPQGGFLFTGVGCVSSTSCFAISDTGGVYPLTIGTGSVAIGAVIPSGLNLGITCDSSGCVLVGILPRHRRPGP